MSKKGCPPVEVNLDAVVEAVKKDLLGEQPEVVEEVQMRSLAGIRFLPSSFNGNEFALGFISVPSIVTFGSKLADAGVLLPHVAQSTSRAIALGLTIAAHLGLGARSFTLGAVMGQVPTALDSMADMLVDWLSTKTGAAPAPAPAGIGDDSELLKLRQDLEQLSMEGVEAGSSMNGVRFMR